MEIEDHINGLLLVQFSERADTTVVAVAGVVAELAVAVNRLAGVIYAVDFLPLPGVLVGKLQQFSLFANPADPEALNELTTMLEAAQLAAAKAQ